MSRLLSFLPYPVNNPAKSLQEFLKKLGVIGVGQRTVYVLVQPACGLIFDQGVSGRGKTLEDTMFIYLFIVFWKGNWGFNSIFDLGSEF